MSDEYLRLAEKPGLNHPGYPICDACNVETTIDDAQWLCPSCGTVWPGDDMESDPSKAMTFPEWSGEELTGPVCPNDEAWRVSHLKHDEREEAVEMILKEPRW